MVCHRLFFTGEYSVPEDFLKKFSRYNFDGFCLGVLFTNRAFSELVLGVCYVYLLPTPC